MYEIYSFLDEQFALVRRAYNVQVTFSNAMSILATPACLTYLFFVLILLVVSPYETYYLDLPFYVRLPYIAVILTIYMLSFIVVRNFFFRYLDGMVAALFSFVIVACAVRMIDFVFFWTFVSENDASLRDFYSSLGTYVVVCIAHTTIFLLYAVRICNFEEDKSQLQIGGKYILIDSINSIESDDHYLIFNTDLDQNVHVRGRLSDVVTQLSYHGIQIHRSIWIAYAAIDRFETKNGSLFIYTKSGEKHRVARPRQKEVLRELNRPLRAVRSA